MSPVGIGKTLHPDSTTDKANLEPLPNVVMKRRKESNGAARLWQASMSQIIKQSDKDRTAKRKLSAKERLSPRGTTENASQGSGVIVARKSPVCQSSMRPKTVWLESDISSDSEQSADGTASIAVISEEASHLDNKQNEATSDMFRSRNCLERDIEKSDAEIASYVRLQELPCQCSNNTLTISEMPTYDATVTTETDDESFCSVSYNASMNYCISSYIGERQKSHRKSCPAFGEGKQSPLTNAERRLSIPGNYIPGKNTLSIQRKDSRESSIESDDGNLSSKCKPTFHQYQLLGDSQLLRFAEQVLHERCTYVNRARKLGMCVSGQTIRDLLLLVKSRKNSVLKNVIVLIGTNDFLRYTPTFVMEKHLAELLRELKKRKTNRIIILTVPPIPRLENDSNFWKRWYRFNDFVRSFTKINSIQIIDMSSHYLTSENKCKRRLFEEFYGKSKRRDDIHLNKLGLFTLRDILMEEIAVNKQ